METISKIGGSSMIHSGEQKSTLIEVEQEKNN